VFGEGVPIFNANCPAAVRGRPLLQPRLLRLQPVFRTTDGIGLPPAKHKAGAWSLQQLHAKTIFKS